MKTKFHAAFRILHSALALLALLSLAPRAPAQVDWGYALSLDGVNDQAQVPATPNLALTNQLTFEAWVYPHTSKCNTIFSRGHGGNANTYYIFQVGYNGAGDCTSRLLSFWAAGAWDTSTATVPLNEWTHVAVTFDGTMKKFYLNGVLDRTVNRPGQLYPSTDPLLYLGRQGTVCNCNFFDGEMDEVRIWNVVRTVGEIQAGMTRILTGTECGLVAYWQFEEAGLTVNDSTPYHHDGTLVNGPIRQDSTIPVFAAVTTLPATDVAYETAALQGSVNPNGLETGAWFQWGTHPGYGNTAGFQQVGSGTTNVLCSTTLPGLTAGVTYYFRLVATNESGTAYGEDHSFTTPAYFTDLEVGLPAVGSASTAWGDYDQDGDMDILLLGTTDGGASGFICRIYRNNADGTFTDANANFEGPSWGSVAWGDCDNDGDLDILATGLTWDDGTHIYRNEGDGTFTNLLTDAPAVEDSTAAWGDYDNDGALDILLAGLTDSGLVAQVWRNQGDETFSDMHAGLPGVEYGSVVWGDYDNDGDLDILLMGLADNADGGVCRVYRNDGGGLFTDLQANLEQVGLGCAAWGDYDNDGDLDILIAGQRSGGLAPVTRLYRNDGGTNFVDIDAGLPGLSYGSAAWGDCDNDGDLDLLLTGNVGGGFNYITRIYRNDGGGLFTEMAAGLPGVCGGTVAWGDYDNDGDLDLLLTGYTSDPRVYLARLYRNNTPVTNTPPAAPTALAAAITERGLTLTWTAASDAQTPARGLTYNLRVGTTPGGCDIVSPQADGGTGRRRLPALGNAQHRLFALLPDFTVGTTYYWSVQAIDAAWTGSPFAPEQSVTIIEARPTVSIPTVKVTFIGFQLDGTVNPNGSETTAWFEWGTDLNYGNQTPAIHLASGTDVVPVNTVVTGWTLGVTYHIRLVATNSAGRMESRDLVFVLPLFSDIAAGLPGIGHSPVAWGDYDNNGYLDILLAGDSAAGKVSQIWRNTGSGFTNLHAGLPGVNSGSVAWGDYNNDGDLDLLLTGTSSSGAYFAGIYRNDGHGLFADINAGLPGVFGAGVAWGDYDRDGDLDFVLNTQAYRNNGDDTFTGLTAGVAAAGQRSQYAWGDYDNDGELDLLLTGFWTSLIYRNNGDGTFTDLNAGLPGVMTGSAAWGDFNNDGHLDFALLGYTSNGGAITRIYRNNGDSTFTDLGLGLPGLQAGCVAWGDYDNDGDLDLLLLGFATSGGSTRLYRNDGQGTFTDLNLGWPGLYYGSAAWGDYDNDGDLDLLLSGMTDDEPESICRVYRNNAALANSAPAAPAGLTAMVADAGVRLSWNSASDMQTPVPGLAYNLCVGTVPGGIDTVSPQADAGTGWRRLPALGNANHRLFAMVTNLPPGLYHWSVQAVDTAFAGGSFAPGDRFYVGPPRFLHAAKMGDGLFQGECGGAPGVTYRLLTSTNLLDWESHTNLTAGADGLFEFIVPIELGFPSRFYRLKWP